MFNMEQKSDRGISWVDNMYRKFGVIYKEVDDSKLIKETSRFVESQMHTVGVNLQNFCAEIMKEFLDPPSDHPTKWPLTDLSLNYGEDIANYGKVKEGLEEFSPLVEDTPEPTEQAVSTDVAKGQSPDFSVDEIKEDTINGAYGVPKDRPAPQPKVLEFQHNGNTNLIEAYRYSKRGTDNSSTFSHLSEKDTSQEIASEVAATSCSEEPEGRVFPTEPAMDFADNIIEEPEDTHLTQDDFLADSSGFTIIANYVEIDESTSCEERIGARDLLKKKRQTPTCAKVADAASQPPASYKGVGDDEYEHIAYWDNGEMDVDVNRSSKVISSVRRIDDSYIRGFVSFDGCEEYEWELL